MPYAHTKYIWPFAYIESNCTWATMEKWWMEQGRIQRERSLKTERMGDANIIPQKSNKQKIKTNHGCETLPGIPDQCRTPERPQKHTTTNTHHQEPNWSNIKQRGLFVKIRTKKSCRYFICGVNFYAFLSLLESKMMSWQLLLFLEKDHMLKVYIQILYIKSRFALMSLHPLSERTLIIRIYIT